MTSRTIGLELGSSTPSRLGSGLYDDFLPQLRGRKAGNVYREMGDNDATVGSVLYSIEQLVRQVEWTVEGNDERLNDLVDRNLAEMEGGWDDFLAAAVTEIQYGWSAFEIVYKRTPDGIGWEKFGYRPQQSLNDWVLDDNGQLEALKQDVGGHTVTIPADKLIHFRTTTAQGPEGRSWLRRAYRSWYQKKRIEDFLVIGVERDLNGMPHAEIPLDVILANGTEYQTWKDLVTRVRMDEQGGVVTPLEYDENNNPLYKFSLLSTQGRPKVDAVGLWRALAGDISSVMLAQFIQLGRDAVGSRALADPQVDLFRTALNALLDSLEEQFHRQATTRLARINGWTEVPRVTHGPVKDVDLGALGTFVLQTAQAGAPWFTMTDDDDDTMDQLRQLAGLSTQDVNTVEE